MLLAEDLLLLLYADDTGRPELDGTRLDLGLAGALLVELASMERVEVAAEDGPVRKGRLHVINAEPTGDDVLDDALALMAEKERKPSAVLPKLHKGLRTRLLERLAERGIVRAEHGKVLGIFPTTRWPAVDAAHERQVRERLHSVLVQGTTPDPRTGALTSLLVAMDAYRKVVPAEDRKALKRRAKEVAAGDWASDAVKRAIADANAAMVAMIAAGTAGTGAAAAS